MKFDNEPVVQYLVYICTSNMPIDDIEYKTKFGGTKWIWQDLVDIFTRENKMDAVVAWRNNMPPNWLSDNERNNWRIQRRAGLLAILQS